jgi:hypothetical protein
VSSSVAVRVCGEKICGEVQLDRDGRKVVYVSEAKEGVRADSGSSEVVVVYASLPAELPGCSWKWVRSSLSQTQ